jgi:PAS domain S-box-containing protein
MTIDNNKIYILSLLEKAVNASSEGITISSMSEEDQPLIYVNKGFEQLTGYAIADILGKNCRFLQGKDTEEEPVEELRRAIRNGDETTVELLNYTKNGKPFWNRLSITPLKNKEGKVTHYVGIQSDITELKETKKRLELANQNLEVFHDRITGELEQAGKAQQFILPAILPADDKIRFVARYEPMDKIGGDYYDVLNLGDGKYGMMIADVTGHGIPAALLTFMTSFAFKNSAINCDSTQQVISLTNEKLFEKMPKGAFITMFYCIFDLSSNILTYTQAGHPPGFIIRPASSELIPLKTKGGIVGVFKNEKIGYGESQIELLRGDKVLLYTDAIVEIRNEELQMIDSRDFADFLLLNCEFPINEIIDKIYQFGLDFSGKTKYDDDFTLVGFEVLT